MRKPNRLYVVGNPGLGLVKIGIAVDVARRVEEIIAGYVPSVLTRRNVQPLRVYATPLARNLELALHAGFDSARKVREGHSRGAGNAGQTEWFSLGRNALSRVDVATYLWSRRVDQKIILETCYGA